MTDYTSADLQLLFLLVSVFTIVSCVAIVFQAIIAGCLFFKKKSPTRLSAKATDRFGRRISFSVLIAEEPFV